MDKLKSLNKRRALVKQGDTVRAVTLDGQPFKWGRVYYYVGTNGGEKLFYRIKPTRRGYQAFGQREAATLFDRIFPVSWKINQLLADRTNFPKHLRTAGEWK